jgi:tetratricopeptide (TPR) repeat protein
MNEQKPIERAPTRERVHELLREAWALHRDGNHRKARKAYRRALELEPDNADANNLMGLLWLQMGQAADALPYIQKALSVQPDSSQSNYNLGVAYVELGQLTEARESFIRAVDLEPDHIDALISLGNVTRLLGILEESARAYRRVLELQPDQVDAMSNLGFLEITRKNFEDAEQLFSQALAQQPGHVRSLAGYGEALIGQRRYQDAEQWLRKALNTVKDSANLHNDLGAVYNHLGRARQAVDQFSQALRIDPMNAQSRLNLGLTLEQIGYLEDAERAYIHTIKSAPGFTDAHFRLAHLCTHASTQDEIDAMRNLFEREGTPIPARVKLAYALGHAYESVGAYSEAFDFISQAHRMRAGRSVFSLEDTVQAFSTLRTFFDRRRIDALRRHGMPDERPVLIVGMPRSGTTLVEQILASHPLVHGSGETGLLGRAVVQLATELKQPYPEGLDALPGSSLRKQAETYLNGLESGAGSAQRIVDTSPMNFMQLGLAAALLPDARFIHVRRDPMDNCLSIYREMLGDMHSYAHDLNDLGDFYQLYEQMMEHWVETLGARMHEITYENLVGDAPGEIRHLLEFCGIPHHPGCLEFHKTERLVSTPAAAQVYQPLYSTSIGAWKRYADHLAPLQAILRPGDHA